MEHNSLFVVHQYILVHCILAHPNELYFLLLLVTQLKYNRVRCTTFYAAFR